MSAKTYNELRDAVKKYSRRNDIDLIFDTMIELAEDYLYPKLRVREMYDTYSTVCVVGDRTLPLPANFEEAVKAWTVTNSVRYPVEYSLDAIDNRNLTGRPRQFVVNDEIEFDVKPDSAYVFQMDHFARPAKLTEALVTNSVLTNYPSIYFYGVMWQVREYSVELELADREFQKFKGAIGKANERFTSSQFGPAPKFAGVQRSTLQTVKMRTR